MSTLSSVARAEALRGIADSPTTVEFRAIALDPQASVYRSGEGLLLVDAHARLIGAMGRVQPRDVGEFYRRGNLDCDLLADRAAYEALRDERDFERAIISTLAGPWQRPNNQIADLVVRRLESGDPLDHVPRELRGEIELQRQLGPVVAGFVAGAAVSFGYLWTTETLADISIDTLAEHRRRGVAAAVVSSLIDDVIAAGKAPVWGAVEGNRGSLRLAQKLGFTQPAGELFVAEASRASVT